MGPIQERFIKILDENQWDIFSVDMFVTEQLLNNKEVRQAVRHLAANGTIAIIEKGKYRRRYFTDENVIACFMIPNGGIAYWSALNAHGLTEQFPNKTFVQNSRRRGERSVFGIGSSFHFVTVKPEKLVGYKTMGYGNHTYFITDVEKTIVDCFDLPQYAGGYYEIIKAFNKAKLSAQKMVRYCKAVNNIAVTKRLAYLTELLKKPDMEYFLRYSETVCNELYNPFNSSLPAKGKYLRKWRLILNMDEEEILEIANPMH
jgi:predicted transcriptional regulator of viral defense system